MIRLINVSKSFAGEKVISQANIDLEKGKITSLIGRNGSGKTTIMNMISRVISPDKGEINLDGINIEKTPNIGVKIAYLKDKFDYFMYESPNKIKEYYKIIYPDFNEEFFDRELDRLSINRKEISRNLSKGNLSLLGLITVLASGADYILLDEILDGIDIVNKKKIIRYLLDQVEEGKAIILSSHQIEELEGISDSAYYIGLDGQVKEIEQFKENINKYQIVTRKILSDKEKEGIIINSQLGRVYTILIEGDIEDFIKERQDLEIVQYDKLDLKYEDIFNIEEAGRDERYY